MLYRLVYFSYLQSQAGLDKRNGQETVTCFAGAGTNGWESNKDGQMWD